MRKDLPLMDPLVPTNPSKRPAEVNRRLDTLERSQRTPGVGGTAAGDDDPGTTRRDDATPAGRRRRERVGHAL